MVRAPSPAREARALPGKEIAASLGLLAATLTIQFVITVNGHLPGEKNDGERRDLTNARITRIPDEAFAFQMKDNLLGRFIGS